MSRLWVKVIKKHRIDRHHAAPCAWGDEHDVLMDMLKDMDLPTPMWLQKNEQEFQQYAKTSFLPDNFVEDVEFQKLEVDFLDDTDQKKRSSDPRNDFSR